MIRLLSRHHPAANPSQLLPLCPAAGQRGRGGARVGRDWRKLSCRMFFKMASLRLPLCQRQSHSGRRPQCGVSVAVGRAADRPVRYMTLADNASTAKLKGKQLCASCVIKMAGEQY